MIDDLVAFDPGVDRRHIPRGERNRLHEEAHEAEADAMLLLEQILVAGAGVDHRRHVDVVVGGEQRRRILRFLQRGCDGLAEPGHLDPLFLAFPGGGRGPGLGFSSRRLRWWWRFRLRRLDPGLRRRTVFRLGRGQHIVLGNSPVLARAVDLRRIDMMLEHRAADRGRQGQISMVGRSSVMILAQRRAFAGSGRIDRRTGDRRLAFAGRWLGCGSRRRCNRTAFPDAGDDRANLDRVTLGEQLLGKRSRDGRRHLDRHLVRFKAGDRLVRGDSLAGLLQPLGKRPLGDRFAQRRDLHIGGHGSRVP